MELNKDGTSSQQYSHVWKEPDLSTCERCGDKDWMASKSCRKPTIGEIATESEQKGLNLNAFTIAVASHGYTPDEFTAWLESRPDEGTD